MAYWQLGYLKNDKGTPLLIKCLLLLALTLVVSNPVFALSKEANLDRFMLAAKKYVKDNNFELAEKYLKKAKAVEIALPDEYYYLSGQLLFVKNDYQLARNAYEAYINSAGKKGDFYIASLERVTEIEEIMTARESRKKALAKQDQLIKSTSAASSSTTTNTKKLNSLKSLYQTNNHENALIKHINFLLSSHSYTGDIIKKPGNKGLTYKLALGKKNAIITTLHDHLNTPTRITSETLDIYGKSASVGYECDKRKVKCWFKKPSDYAEWIIIDFNEKAAREVAESLTSLIQILQRNSQ